MENYLRNEHNLPIRTYYGYLADQVSPDPDSRLFQHIGPHPFDPNITVFEYILPPRPIKR